MSAVRSLAVAAALVLAATIPSTALVQGGATTAGTQVAVDGSDVTVSVTIDLIIGGIGEQELPEGSQEVADEVAAAIETYWNQGLERYATDCLNIKLDVVINALPNGDPPSWRIVDLGEGRDVTIVTQPGHHVAFWMDGGAHGSPAPPVTFDPYDDDGIAPPGEDYGSPYQQDLYAYWSPHLEDARDFAHEFGHLLGFGDDYDSNGALPGRDGTLMADGDLIDQNLADRLAELARGANDDVPECEVWEGTFTYDFSGTPEVPPCDSLYSVRFTVTEGVVSGEVVQEENTCPGASPRDDITGSRTGDTLNLEFFGSGAIPLEIVDNRVTATFSSIELEVRNLDVRCVTCEASAP